MPDMNIPLMDENAIYKEVWNTDSIGAKTELNPGQIANVNKAKLLGRIMGTKLIDVYLDEFMILQKSKNRSSMKEFIEGIRAKKTDMMEQGKGFLGNIFG